MFISQQNITVQHQNKLKELFQILGAVSEIRLYEPARGNLVLVLVMNSVDVAHSFPNLVNGKLSDPAFSNMTMEQLRCHTFCNITPATKRWFNIFSLPGRKPAYLHDIMLFPPNWQSELEELKQAQNYYTTVAHGFVESLGEREPLISLVRS